MNAVALTVDRVAASLLATFAVTIGLSVLAIAAGVLLGLTRTGSIGLYFVVWWTILFAILPVRITSQAESGEVVAGSEPGAPSHPALRERAIWTTLASAALFVLVAYFFPLAGL